MAKESTKGVWKSGSGRGRVRPKGKPPIRDLFDFAGHRA